MAIDASGIPTRAIIYCRISRDREGAGLGVERQREDCESLAAQLGIEVVAVYTDNDLSAYSGKPRPGYLKLLDDLRAGRADTVLAWHTDRLHRSPAELEEYINVCEPRQVETRTVKAGHLDLTTATGRMIARQLGVQARYEVERMIERQRRTRDQMAEQGRHFGGRRPFGYEDDRITPNALHCPSCGALENFTVVQRCPDCQTDGPFVAGRVCGSCHAVDGVTLLCVCRCGDDAEIVEGSEAWHVHWAADALLAGSSLRAVSREWNERGVLTSLGNAWGPNEVRDVMLRPRNAGIIRHRGQEAGPAQWPALLDEATWRSLVAHLTEPGRRTSPGAERKYLGSGLFKCGTCSAPMTTVSSNGGGVRSGTAYGCRAEPKRHVVKKIEPVDLYVASVILKRLARPDAADLLAAEQDPVDVRGAQRAMREARERLDALAEEFGAGELDIQEWRVARKAAREKLQQAESVMASAVEVNPVAGLIGSDDIEAEWKKLDLSRRRSVIDYLAVVTLHPASKGRQPGGGYFDQSAVKIAWKRE